MSEDVLYSLIGRMFVDLRAAQSRIQQLQEQLEAATKKSEPPPDVDNQPS